MNNQFPQYRKYKNNLSYFKIISPTQFEEIKIHGKQKTLHKFEAKILPDRNYINDMLHDYQEFWEKISANEYEQIKKEL